MEKKKDLTISGRFKKEGTEGGADLREKSQSGNHPGEGEKGIPNVNLSGEEEKRNQRGDQSGERGRKTQKENRREMMIHGASLDSSKEVTQGDYNNKSCGGN